MTWTQHISKRHNRPFWHNSKTNKSVWVKPADFIEPTPTPTPIPVPVPVPAPKSILKKKEEYRESTSNSMLVANNNGQSWAIEGQSHWTSEDYREALSNLNQAMRDR